MIKRSHISALLGVAAIAVTGCGSDKKSDTSSAGPQATAPAPAAAPGKPPGPISTVVTKKPAVPTPTGSPPPSLVVRDIVKGKGAGAKAGDALTMQYEGVSWSTGQEFDASWNSGQPFKFQLGAGMVIPGWDQGLVGIKPGGRRELVIPPDLAYGPQGQPPTIAPNETLVFVVDAVKVGG